MNLYLLRQNQNIGYDTYDSMVVAAETEEEARLIHPNQWSDNAWGKTLSFLKDWADTPDQVTVELLGVAVDGMESGVVISSFNAG